MNEAGQDACPTVMPEEKRETSTANGRTGSVSAFRLFGVPVRLHFTFLMLLGFLLFIGIGGKQSGLATALYILALFASVLLHEVAHALVARHHGVKTLEIVMYPIGGVSRPERPLKTGEEFWVALAGPAVNALIAAVLFGWVAWRQGVMPLELLRDPTDANLIQRIAFGNLLLCLFNLLPAYPMDGGRLLRSILAMRRPEDQATRIAAGAGQVFAFLMGLAGLLFGNFLLVFVAMFVWLGAAQEGAAVRGRILSTGFTVRDAMITDFRTLSHGDSIRAAGNLLLSTSQHDFPVLTGGNVIGLLSRSALVRAMLTEGPDAYVAGAMDRDFVRVAPDQPLAEALPLVQGTPASCALVMDGDRLLGLLTSENISEFLLLREALARTRSHPDWSTSH